MERCVRQDFITFSLVQSLSCVRLFVTPRTAAYKASLSITNSWSLPKLMSIESVMPSNHLILCRPLLLPSIFPSIRFFSNESALCISIGLSASTSVLPMSTQDWSLGWTGWISLQSKGLLTDSLQSESYISPQHSVSEPLWTPHHSLVTTIRHLAQYPWTYCHYSPGLRDAHNALTNTGAIPISPKLTAVSDDPQLVPHHPVCDSSHTTVSGNPLLHSKARTACSCPLCTWHTPV